MSTEAAEQQHEDGDDKDRQAEAARAVLAARRSARHALAVVARDLAVPDRLEPEVLRPLWPYDGYGPIVVRPYDSYGPFIAMAL